MGFTTYFEEQMTAFMEEGKLKTCVPARVVLEHKHSYRVLAAEGEWLATMAGHFAYTSHSRGDFPAVGDWVLVEKMAGEEKAIIHKLFARKSLFSRKAAGKEMIEQIVASNVDIVLLVMSLNADFNIRRLERYLVATWDSGAKPVIVLTKVDLCSDVESYVREIETIAFDVDVFMTSALSGEGLADIRVLFAEGITVALLGSSGAGKSTLTNALVDDELMKVLDIREDDAKGRHITTHRELVVLPSGGCLIDTPGMRELQLWDQGDSLSISFKDIEELASVCHYRDCSHRNETKCAVQQAIRDGELEELRLQSYFKLQKELAFIERKTNTRQDLMSSASGSKLQRV